MPGLRGQDLTGSRKKGPLPPLSFVTGGARSGKSALAERLALLGPAPHVYVATAEAGDAEMRARIARHRADRRGRFATREAPHDLAGGIADAAGTLLVDCATLWLSNRLLAGADLEAEAAALLAAIAACPARVIVVSNEVGAGIVPDNPLARAFRDAQGRLNQRLAAASGLAVLVVAGLPVVLRGRLPAGLA
jgi:adenosylcobinamide kinase/adenosylcobinamide-phosphate guanylyltransferase